MRGWVMWLGGLGLLSGCDPEFAEGEEDDLRTLSAVWTSGSDGRSEISFDVEGESSFLVTLRPEAGYSAFVETLTDPDGNQVLVGSDFTSGSYEFTNAVYADAVSSLGWPITDGELSEGTWTLGVGVVDEQLYFANGVDFEVEAQLKEDTTFSEGELAVDVVYAGSAVGDGEVIAAVEEAVAYWEDIYADIGITLDVRYWDIESDDPLNAPGVGSGDTYESIAETTRFRAINVVIVDSLTDTGLFGMAGGIPGPLFATGQSAVVVSASMHSGDDLAFSNGEIAILGETMAHEAGHFLGLFHPVESTYDLWDVLDDTPECSSADECQAVLENNLMFPYPVCDSNSCVPQNELSDGQAAVGNRYVAVR